MFFYDVLCTTHFYAYLIKWSILSLWCLMIHSVTLDRLGLQNEITSKRFLKIWTAGLSDTLRSKFVTEKTGW